MDPGTVAQGQSLKEAGEMLLAPLASLLPRYMC